MKTQKQHWRKKSYQKVTLETKLLVIDQILNGQVSTNFASKKYDVPRTTITYWLRIYSTLVQQNTGMSKDKEIKKLKEKIEELEFQTAEKNLLNVEILTKKESTYISIIQSKPFSIINLISSFL